MSWETIRYSRGVLYEQVWSQPIMLVAKSYGISDVGLAKICQRLRVPRPGRGHWERLRHGKVVRQQALPPLRPGEPDEYMVERWKKPVLDPTQTTEFDLAATREEAPENRIVVQLELAEPHRLVVLAEKSLRHGSRGEHGLLKPRSPGRLNILVSRECLDRALRIADALLKALELRGYSVSVDGGQGSLTSVAVLDEELGFWIEEVLDTTERQLTARQQKDKERNPWAYSKPQYDYIPTGRLALKIATTEGDGIRRTWSDAGKQRLEDCLNRFIEGMIRAAERQRAARLERERQDREWKEKEHQRLEEQRQQEEERQRSEMLTQQIDAWSRARRIRDYIADMRENASKPESWTISKIALPDWMEWALRHADSIDPVAPIRKARQPTASTE